MPLIVSIDGGIAIGKSTLCGLLEECGYKVLKEGLNEWGEILTLFYANPKRYCFTLQCAILLNMRTQYKYIQSLPDEIVFIERSPLSAFSVFVENSKNSKLLTNIEYNIYKKLHNELGWNPDYIIGLTLNPNVAYERLKKRNRTCEQNTTLEYITQVSELYEITFKKWSSYIKSGRLSVKKLLLLDAIDSENIILIKVIGFINNLIKN